MKEVILEIFVAILRDVATEAIVTNVKRSLLYKEKGLSVEEKFFDDLSMNGVSFSINEEDIKLNNTEEIRKLVSSILEATVSLESTSEFSSIIPIPVGTLKLLHSSSLKEGGITPEEALLCLSSLLQTHKSYRAYYGEAASASFPSYSMAQNYNELKKSGLDLLIEENFVNNDNLDSEIWLPLIRGAYNEEVETLDNLYLTGVSSKDLRLNSAFLYGSEIEQIDGTKLLKHIGLLLSLVDLQAKWESDRTYRSPSFDSHDRIDI